MDSDFDKDAICKLCFQKACKCTVEPVRPRGIKTKVGTLYGIDIYVDESLEPNTWKIVDPNTADIRRAVLELQYALRNRSVTLVGLTLRAGT